MLESLQGHQDADRHRRSPSLGFFGEALSEALLDGVNESLPWEGIGPLPHGITVRNEGRPLSGRADTTQPMVKIASKTPVRLS